MNNISYRIEPISVITLLKGIDEGHIEKWADIEEARVIHQPERAEYITSIMAGIPVMPLLFDGTKSPWTLLDGKKRFSLIWGFYNNKYQITQSDYFNIGTPKFYNELPMYLKRKFCSTTIYCIILNPPTSATVVEDVKNRIKTTFSI